MSYFDERVFNAASEDFFGQYVYTEKQKAKQLGRLVKSPIEFTLAAWLMYYGSFDVFTEKLDCDDARYLVPQFRIGKYTADFLVCYKNKSVVIECDGHDFHEKTKAQAAHDKKRDRFIQSQGYSVLRFTGHEIYTSAEDCVNEICNYLEL
jgi:hypothetical protein